MKTYKVKMYPYLGDRHTLTPKVLTKLGPLKLWEFDRFVTGSFFTALDLELVVPPITTGSGWLDIFGIGLLNGISLGIDGYYKHQWMERKQRKLKC